MKTNAHFRRTSRLLCIIYGLAFSFPQAIPIKNLAQVGNFETELLHETVEDVKRSGYYFLLCNNIHEAWQMCEQTNSEKVDDWRIPDYEECSQFEGTDDKNDQQQLDQCLMVNDYREFKCRNEILLYFASMYHTEMVWTAFAESKESREWLCDKCNTVFTANPDRPGFPLTSSDEEILLQVLGDGEDVPRGLADLRPTLVE